jgi:hypothetical protein
VEEDPDGLLYLEREVNVLKGMRHPNIVQFIGIAVVRWFSLPSSFFHSSFRFVFFFFFVRFRSFSCETKVVVLIGGLAPSTVARGCAVHHHRVRGQRQPAQVPQRPEDRTIACHVPARPRKQLLTFLSFFAQHQSMPWAMRVNLAHDIACAMAYVCLRSSFFSLPHA